MDNTRMTEIRMGFRFWSIRSLTSEEKPKVSRTTYSNAYKLSNISCRRNVEMWRPEVK